jgi:Na+-driven multidrug efflux pump
MVSKAFLKSVWRLAFPVILTNLLQASMTVIDTIMIGRLGPEALAAVGMGNMIRLLVLISILSISGGAMSLMAQAWGGRDPQRMSFVTRQSLISGLLLSFVIAIIGLLVARPLWNSEDNTYTSSS